jgi:hypothetical protein
MPSFLKRLFSGKSSPEQHAAMPISQPAEVSPARELLKQATALKKELKYQQACDKLREAYAAGGAENLMTKDRLRLPMYLQLAGKSDEGWAILNDMSLAHLDVFSQAEIADQMRVFLEKEGKLDKALVFLAWTICRELERDRANIQSSLVLSDQLAKMDLDYGFLGRKNEKVLGHTPAGNPITDTAYDIFTKRVAHAMSVEGVQERFAKLLKKAKQEHCSNQLSAALSAYFSTATRFDLGEVRGIVVREIGAAGK